MSLTSKDVLEITRLLEGSSFTELHLELDGLKLSLRRGAISAESTPLPAITAQSPEAASTSAASKGTAPVTAEAAGAAVDPGVCEVTAPLLGILYLAPKPGAAPFVDIGSTVDEDTVIAIIEVMKLMNPVRAGVRGTVTEILGSDGALVEYGQTLLRVRKAP